MIYAREPTEEERMALKPMSRQAISRVSQGAHLILLSAQRHPVPELARLFAMSRATVRFWIRRFDAHGPAGLYDGPRRGRPGKVTPHVQETLVTMLQDDPRHEGYPATFWTVAMLGLALAHTVAVRLSVSALRFALHGLGLRWGRPRLAMPPKVDPEKTCKQWVIAKAVVGAGPEATVLYRDESRLQLLPPAVGDVALGGRADSGAHPGYECHAGPVWGPEYAHRVVGVSGPRTHAHGRFPRLFGSPAGHVSPRPQPAHLG
jgi:transposase